MGLVGCGWWVVVGGVSFDACGWVVLGLWV